MKLKEEMVVWQKIDLNLILLKGAMTMQVHDRNALPFLSATK